MQGTVKIGFVADIHAGESAGTKRGDMAVGLLRQTLFELERDAVDLVVDLGDRINNGPVERELEALQSVGQVFAESGLSRIHLVGNHDIMSLSVSEHERVLARSCRSNVTDVHGFRIIQWVPDVSIGATGFTLTDADLAWLAGELNHLHGPAVLLSHVPISEASMIGNYYFQQYPGGAGNYWNAAEARRIVRDNPWLSICVAGHVHWNSIHTVDGVRHLTVQSLTESFTTGGQPAAAYAVLELSLASMTLDVRGLDPFRLTLPISFPRSRWPEPLG